jgi:hypothetical protein
MDEDLGRIRKDTVMAHLRWYMHRAAEENHEKHPNSRCSGQDSKGIPSGYVSSALLLNQPVRHVIGIVVYMYKIYLEQCKCPA